MSNRWIKLSDKICDWQWYGDGNTMRVFLHLLLRATRQDYQYHGIILHRGEVAITYGDIAKKLRISYSATRTAISHMLRTGEIAIKKYPKYSVITVINYDAYQTNRTQNSTQRATASAEFDNRGEKLLILTEQDRLNKSFYTRARAREENKNIIPVKRVAAHAYEERSDDSFVSSLADIYAN